jgi:cell division protein FtsW
MLALVGIGCVFVYSASFYSAEIAYKDSCFFLKKQLFGIAVGIVCYVVFSLLNYNILQKFRWWLTGIAMLLLGLVFVPGIGLTNYGATRWINLRFITFQPSEIAKFTIVLFLATDVIFLFSSLWYNYIN